MSLIGIDFETAYRSRKNKGTPGPRYSLRSMTYIEYIRSERFKVHGVGIKIDHGKTEWINSDIQYVLSSLFKNSNTHNVYAHNGLFDFAIMSFHYRVHAGRYLCTQAMSRALWPSGKHSLAALTKTLNPDLAKGDELAKFDGLWDLTPEQDRELGDYCSNDVDITYANLAKMVSPVGLDFPVAELDLIDLTHRLYVEPRLQLDHGRVRRHAAHLDAEEARIIAAGGVAKSTLSSNAKFAAWLEKAHGIHVPTKPSPTAKKPHNRSLALAKDDLEFIQLQKDYPQLKPVWEARIVANSSGDRARCATLLSAAQVSHINRAGVLPVPLLYYGAGTGRYSGTQKLNLQNLPRGGELRKSIVAPEGYQIVVADLSNIEARMLAYIAGCDTLLEAFAENRDIYSEFASKIYERKIDRKYRAQDDAGNYLDKAGNITDYDGAYLPDYIEGHVGKTSVLGLGYGMGPPKYKDTLAKGALGGPPVHITEADARRTVHTLYRKTYAEIPALWREGDRILSIMSDPTVFARQKKEGREPQIWCKCQVEYQGLRLPNGLRLDYPGLRWVASNDEESGHWAYWNGKYMASVWGGGIVQRCTQALSRIAMTDPMMVLDNELSKRYGGLTGIVHTVHDELLALAPTEHAQDVLDRMNERLCQRPPWADDTLVLAAEGGFDTVYSK